MHADLINSKKFMVSESAGKLKATVFWDTEGILLIHYKEKGVNITREYILKPLQVAIKKIREENGLEMFFFCKTTGPRSQEQYSHGWSM